MKKAVENLPFEEWAETLRKTFNDSVRRIQVVKGIFKKGDNALVDKDVFKKDTVDTAPQGYTFSDVYGKTIKTPETWATCANKWLPTIRTSWRNSGLPL